MKRILLLSAALAMGASMFAGAMLFALRPAEVKASGPTSGSISSPMNINLNDKTEAEVRSYYSSLNGKNLSGNNLLMALRPILQDFTYYSYDACWQMYEITDREWALSPASEITQGSYSSTTGIVSNYRFGTSMSKPGADNPYVRVLYRNRDENGTTVESGQIRNWQDHTQTGGFNREHVWCQSRGFKFPGSGAAGPAGTDIHHLMSGDGFVNGSDNQHNNNPYGFVDTSKKYYDAATMGFDYGLYCAGNLCGKPVNSSASDVGTKVFEPQDCDKGDIARACFYMVACYNNLSGKETITQYNPDLTLCDYATSNSGSEVSSEVGHAVGMGILRDLLAWHRLDPVDDFEIHRNNLIDRNFQHNRNPFIDYPDWVEAIWGEATLDPDTKKVTYDPTPVGYADPEHDDVRTYGESWATVTSIAVSNPTTEFTVGDEFAFGGTVTATMSDSSQQDVTSSCTFEGYDLDSAGNQTVTVTHVPSGVTTTYSITVTEPVVPVSISVSGQKTSFNLGDEFTFGGTVTLTYSDSSKETVTDCTYSGYDMSVAGNQTVTVTHASTGLTTTYGINVIAPAADSEGYTLIKDASELRVGDQLVLGALSSETYYGMTGQISVTGKTFYREATAIDAPEEDVLSPDNVESLKTVTLGKDDSKWTLLTDEGYLCAPSNSSNWISSVPSVLDDTARWTIDINNDGTASIVAVSSEVRGCMRFNYNNGNPRFACYAATSSIKVLPMIFKSYSSEADNYGKAFIDTYTAGCKSSGIGSTIDWNSASTAYTGLTNNAKGILSSIAPNAGTAYRFQAVARYDYIVGKYGTGTYANFMGRSIDTNNGAWHSSSTTAFNWQSIVLVCLGTCAIVSVGFFFIVRKKKEA